MNRGFDLLVVIAGVYLLVWMVSTLPGVAK